MYYSKAKLRGETNGEASALLCVLVGLLFLGRFPKKHGFHAKTIFGCVMFKAMEQALTMSMTPQQKMNEKWMAPF